MHDNCVGPNPKGKSVAFVGANNNRLENNWLAGRVASTSHEQEGQFIYKSFDNVEQGNVSTGPKPAAGTEALPGSYLNILPGPARLNRIAATQPTTQPIPARD